MDAPEAAAAAQADIVVGLTSYNDSRTVGAVARAVRDGLARHFGSSTARIVLADAGSTDATREVAREAIGPDLLAEVDCSAALAELPYHGHPNRAGALHAVLQAVQQGNAKACAFVDAGLDTLEPDWVDRLIAPVLTGGFDYVSPYYLRQAHEGAITKGIVYPMFRALYGVRLRQPAAGEFGCSAALAAHFLRQDFWDADHAQVGIDLWLATAAVCGGFQACEAALGARPSLVREKASDLSTVLAQVVGALFADLDARVDAWQRVRSSVEVPVFGTAPASGAEGGDVDVNRLIESFRLGYQELREIWTWVLPPRTIVELRKLAASPRETFRFDDLLWVGIIYDFAFGYSQRVMPIDHLLRSLTPLYAGWLASFALQTEQATLADVEARVERVCAVFETEKRYLIARWRWPERFR